MMAKKLKPVNPKHKLAKRRRSAGGFPIRFKIGNARVVGDLLPYMEKGGPE